ncbi:hypothetical protein [Polaromonas sp. CG_23.6]|uniref:hypothetical protein n=1 Tax=Polaromonas sp. CG_23.6 TaxID=2760709 RepID=UPI0024733A7B|nr:hypothetical protein [Polaromonas sp. CG_23.6]MDH6186798.1 hypothetical protein [Polaromonas sp. CG_23.6]
MINNQGNPPSHRSGLPDDPPQSMLGEEDPQSALDLCILAHPTFAVESGMDVETKEDDAVMAARALQLREALSRCDNNGGEGLACPQDTFIAGEVQTEVHLTNAELKQLQLRVIALENLVTALLAEASDRQLDLAGALAAYITPKQGFTPHHLTTHAARQMKHLIRRAGVLKAMPPS